MLFIVLLLMVSVPVLEIVAIIRVSEMVGAAGTIALMLGTSIAGLLLLRVVGALALRDFRAHLQRGDWPGRAAARGAAAVVGGSLLIAPGFVTDALGVLLLAPPTRWVLVALAERWVSRRTVAAHRALDGGGKAGPGRSSGRRAGRRGRPSGHSDTDAPSRPGVEVIDVRRIQPADGPVPTGETGTQEHPDADATDRGPDGARSDGSRSDG